jgi:hypothetical protein
MAAPDPEDRQQEIPDAEQRWRERGNPPSQPVSKPVAFFGWGFWVVAGVVLIAIVIAIVYLLSGVHAG